MAALSEGANRGNFFPLGDIRTPLYVVGTLATDYICEPGNVAEVEDGGKLTVYTRKDMNDIVKRNGIVRGRAYPGSSTGNFVNQVAEIAQLDPDYGRVRLFTTLAPEAETTDLLTHALDEKGVITEVTPWIGRYADNPEALLVPRGKQTKIVSLKAKRTPAIQVFLPEGEEAPGVVFVNASAGKSAKSIRQGLEFAEDHDVPIGTVATGSEVKELSQNSELLDAHTHKLRRATFFAGNIDEMRGIMEATNSGAQRPDNPTELALRFREMFQNEEMIILLTEGSQGSRVLVGGTVYREEVLELDPAKFDNTVGAGDTKAAAFAGGIRMWGADTAGIMHALPRATRAAESVMMHPDARTGQPTGQQWLQDVPRGYHIDMEELPKWF